MILWGRKKHSVTIAIRVELMHLFLDYIKQMLLRLSQTVSLVPCSKTFLFESVFFSLSTESLALCSPHF